jgi:hypothetical protein
MLLEFGLFFPHYDNQGWLYTAENNEIRHLVVIAEREAEEICFFLNTIIAGMQKEDRYE